MSIRLFVACIVLSSLGAVSVSGQEQATQPDALVTKPATTAKAEKDVKQDKKTVHLKEIVVTATRTEKGITDAPGDVHVVTAEDIEKRNIKTIDEALNTTAGVFNRRGKGIMDTLANISIRGVPGANRSLIMKDGVPVNSAYTGDVSWTGAIGGVKRIEVVEGPVSSLYGGYAMGGVVNIITKMPEKRELILNSGYGTSWNRGEAMDDLWRSYFSYGDKLDKLSLFVSYGYQATNGFPTTYNTQSSKPGGTTGAIATTDNTGTPKYIVGDKGKNGWWDDSIALKAAYDFSKVTRLELGASRMRSAYDYGTPNTYLRNSSGNPVYLPTQYSYLSGDGGTEINIYTAVFETEIASAKTKFNFGLNDVQNNWYTTPDSSATINNGTGKLSSTPSQNYFTDLQATFPISRKQLLTVGAAFTYGKADNKEYTLLNWKDESTKAGITYQAGGVAYSYALFLQDEIGILDNLTAYVGVRGDGWTTTDGYTNDTAGLVNYTSRSAEALSPKLALVYKPFDRTTVRTSGGMAFRPPTVYELFRKWESSTTVYRANAFLKPETITSWDISVDQGLWKGAKVKGTYFENYFEDMVYRISDGTEGGKPAQIWTNAGRAETQGGVLEIEQKIAGFRLFANATILTESKITSNSTNPDSVGKKITYLPENLYNVGVDFVKGPFTANVTGIYVGKMFRNDTNTDTTSGVYTSQDPYTVVNAKIGYDVTKFLNVSLSVDNIFNEQYFAYYKAPGRSWFAEMTMKL
ncbi:MAG: TonB-dependent receptor [Nitrospirota bacterium]